jgi:hypothetical protein
LATAGERREVKRRREVKVAREENMVMMSKGRECDSASWGC